MPCEWARKTIDANTGCRYMECSAQTQEGIAELFKLAIDIVLKGLKSKQNAKSKSTQKQNGTADCACVLM